MPDGSIDEGDFLIENHLLREITKVLENEMYRGMSESIVVGVLTSLAMDINFQCNMSQHGDQGDSWKDQE